MVPGGEERARLFLEKGGKGLVQGSLVENWRLSFFKSSGFRDLNLGIWVF